MQDKIQREKEYHNKRFSNKVRRSAQKFYAIEKESCARFRNLLISDSKGKKVLELGCGIGSNTFDIAKEGTKVDGIDISEVEIEYFHLKTLFAVPFRNYKLFNLILKTFQKFDKLLFSIFPFIRKQAWQIVITASKSMKRV